MKSKKYFSDNVFHRVLQQNFKIYSHSFDKGFYSKGYLQALQQSGIHEVVMPEKKA